MKVNKILRRLLRFSFFLICVLIGLALLLLTPVDKTPYQETVYYRQMKARLENIRPDSTRQGESLKVGWAKVNITPEEPLSIASYGIRPPFEGVTDSLWVRTFVFDNGDTKAALITLDLLIFPPVITKRLQKKLPVGFTLQNTYLSATHTHNGAGGWAEGIGGRILGGAYNEAYVEKIINSIVQSIEKASLNLEKSQIGFGKCKANQFVRNRLVRNGEVDPWIRVIKIRKHSGATALLTTFSAHATCWSSKVNKISRDYPGAFIDILEARSDVDFAAFCAGAVGSHAPMEHNRNNEILVELMARGLYRKVEEEIGNIQLSNISDLNFITVPLNLREPHLKVTRSYRLKPWVFKLLFGDYPRTISAMKVGDIVLIGTPCDFSGALVDAFDAVSEKKGIQLIVTSFNGGYIGYVTEDKYYDLKKNETQEMNWYGPFNGAYFVEVMKEVIEKM